MKSIKFMLTSVICLIIASYWSFMYIFNGRNILAASLVLGIMGTIALIFFVLGWVTKDNPLPPKPNANERKENKTE